ncbi:MAG: hypothetical protein WD825_13425 [Gemmatimonadaceae bacterium]
MRALKLSLALGLLTMAACARQATTTPDPRVGLKAGLMDAGEAVSNLKILANVPPPERFVGSTNSDLAFTGNYAIQGNYNGFQVWDITNPGRPVLKTSYFCPASQSDVSVYKNLLFVSGEGTSGRLDCGAQGVRDTVSAERLRGLRIFDISDIANPKYIANVQTCRGSHTHTVVEDPKDRENIYVYISGSAGVRSPRELPGCSALTPDQDPNSSLFRIEVIRVPLATPTNAAIASSPRFFNNLVAPPRHGDAPEDIAARKKAVADAKASGGFVVIVDGTEQIARQQTTRQLLDSIVVARGGTGAATATDSAALRASIQSIMDARAAAQPRRTGPRPGPTQCHDITVYPAIGLAGGACAGYGFLLDISDVTNPRRIAEVADSNFAFWHSATFNNDGTKILFSDEWGGGGSPKCRVTDKKEWGADAIFTIEGRKMNFQSYYKLPAPQTSLENCVAHNGSLIPIPGRDVMAQAWYQGGISVFDWTDPKHPQEIAFFDRGPVDSTRQGSGGTWSAYWYNGAVFSSEIARGLDVVELTPSEFVTQNEIDAAKTVHQDYFNAQGQPKFVWPPSFSLARAYADQLERSKCLGKDRLASVRQGLASAETSSGAQRREGLLRLAADLQNDARGSCDAPKIGKLATTARELAGIQP